MDIKIHCKYDKLEKISDLKEHPKNRNKHGNDQIEHLSRLYKHNGIRHPIIVSKLSGLICAGHGRLMAAKKLKMETFPIVYQDFESKKNEYAFLQSDNAISSRSELDLSGIRMDLADFGKDFEIDSLGLLDFNLNEQEVEFPNLQSKDPDFQQRTFILSNEQNDILNDAMKKAEKEEDCSDEINQNKNGNILTAILKSYVNS